MTISDLNPEVCGEEVAAVVEVAPMPDLPSCPPLALRCEASTLRKWSDFCGSHRH